MHYAINVFSEPDLFNILEKVEEIQCSFYYGDIVDLRNHILNIDQLEMKHALVSGGSIV